MAELDGVLSKEIVEHGLREFPNECCGLIAAADGVPAKVFTMTNADASPVTYRLDGTEQLRIFDRMDDEGLELWAIYHSHTHSEAYPSPTDIRRAHYPAARRSTPTPATSCCRSPTVRSRCFGRSSSSTARSRRRS